MQRDEQARPAHLIIVRATVADATTILALHEEAARWLVARGIQQWLPGDFAMEPLVAQIGRGEAYLARIGGEPVGTFTLQWADPRIWGEQPDDAGYVHGLAVRRTYAGRGLGRVLLDSAGQMAAATGKTYLRLDCMTENPALRAYYEAAGFAHRGDVRGKTWSASRYEKRVDGA
jgi:protein-tyrosine phosphatase